MESGWRGSPSLRSVRSSISEIEELPSPSPPLQEEVLYVAVKKEVKECKANFLWAIENVGRGNTIVLLHVLKPPQHIPTLLGKLPASVVSPEEVNAYMLLEKNKVEKCLDEYKTLDSRSMVRMENKVIEANDVANGLVEYIAQNQVTKLVMGAAMDKHSSSCRKRKQLKSRKASSVNQLADLKCQILFVCKGYLICTREASLNPSREEQSPFTSPNSVLSQSSRLSPLPLLQNALYRSEEKFTEDYVDTRSFDAQEFKNGAALAPRVPKSRLSNVGSTSDPWEGVSRGSHLTSAYDEEVGYSGTLSLHRDDESEGGTLTYRSAIESEANLHILSSNHGQGDLDVDVFIKLQQALRDAANLEKEVYEESRRRRQAEIDAVSALHRVKESENQYNHEFRYRKEIEETLGRENNEFQKLKEQQDEIIQQLEKANDQKLELELQIAESVHVNKGVEEELFNARNLLFSLQKDLNMLQKERDVAVKEAESLRQKTEVIIASTAGDLNSEFSYLELERATQNFSSSVKIGEGGFGTVYKGFLRNTTVAIKVLHPLSLQGKSQFHQEVAILSRVRHPNLVTLIGSCSEALALVYEFLPNGSLEDHLIGTNKSLLLTWQVRTRIIGEICSALIFLHSDKPHPVVHGDLKAANILLDANFVSKIGDFGISTLLDQSKTTTTLFRNTHLKGTLAHIDPEFVTTGQVTTKSDVYAFGVIILQLLTGKSPLNLRAEMQEALDNNYLHAIIDQYAGDWPFVQANQLVHLGLRCCEMRRKDRPDLQEVWKVVEPMMRIASLSASPFTVGPLSDDTIRTPSYFFCPVFQDIMRDPYIAADGFTYEAEAIKGWIDSGHDTSPMTNLKLPNLELIPNRTLRSAIQEWLQQHPV